MSNENTTPAAVVDGSAYPADQPLAEIFKEDDTYFLRDLVTGVVSDPIKVNDDDCLCLPSNSANRKWLKNNVVDKYFADGHETYPLLYKASRKLGPVGRRIPNEALRAYLSAEEADEVLSLVNKAYDAMEADKPVRPTTDKEKILARIAKLQKMLTELDADDADETVSE